VRVHLRDRSVCPGCRGWCAFGEKQVFHEVLYSTWGLADEEHTISIVVTGKKHSRADNASVSIDAFRVVGAQPECDVRFKIINEWNYPELSWGNYGGVRC
jgi:hypothetical protein